MEVCSWKNNRLKRKINYFNTFEHQLVPIEKQLPSMIRLKIGRIQQIITFFVWALIFFIPLMFGDFEDEVNWIIFFGYG
ncbi:hypothetical protein JCM21142_221 [Saccharicrinis fermentans DSM 9555 = JCM 21142]|uniref:Uncharacterized protein n=1 Tax=Saccharicrinis fermentans DSM 9555 = JCM 21142 TaxID=869213 RepID=W7YG97_9BACT|nr:hypothetical protein JCM21142_221 [Saccharicrinis fermentans DSM 9555 = JCM 21142]